jgi:hypothetical protein
MFASFWKTYLTAFKNIIAMLASPRQTSRRLADETSLRPAAAFVLTYAAVWALISLRSHFMGDYPPPAEEMAVWIETWGEFTMLPFLAIPASQYRLFMAIILIPLVLAMWMLMAATTRLLARLCGGRVSFDQNLNLFAYTFFPCWLISWLLDVAHGLALSGRLIAVLHGEYGNWAATLAAGFPVWQYTTIFTLAGVYNAIAVHSSENQAALRAGEHPKGLRGYAWWKAALAGWLTFLWPMLLAATMLR